MNKKYSALISLAVLGLLLFSSASAQTDTAALIRELQEQLKVLQARIAALREAQSGVQEARKDVKETLKLIRELREGMSGEEIRLLQTILSADSEVYPEGLITGFYGRLTAAAVRRFQKKQGLEQVGRVGPRTLEKLNKKLEENPVGSEDRPEGKRHCAIIPPGHLIAPGWLRKQGGVRPIVPECQVLPPGIAKKLPGATTTPPTPPPSGDVSAPVISAISVTNIASTSARISWNTDEASDSKVWYGTSTPVLSSSPSMASSASLVTSHVIDLSGLSASTTHYFLVGSKDASGNNATSSENSFLTSP